MEPILETAGERAAGCSGEEWTEYLALPYRLCRSAPATCGGAGRRGVTEPDFTGGQSVAQVLLQDALDDLAKRTSLTLCRVVSGAPERVVDLHGEVRPPPGRHG